jgi:hypothetical protein
MSGHPPYGVFPEKVVGNRETLFYIITHTSPHPFPEGVFKMKKEMDAVVSQRFCQEIKIALSALTKKNLGGKIDLKNVPNFTC